eukprot:g29150.t1
MRRRVPVAESSQGSLQWKKRMGSILDVGMAARRHCVFFHNAPIRVNEATLKRFFERAGNVRRLRLFMENGQSRGMGLCEYMTPEAALARHLRWDAFPCWAVLLPSERLKVAWQRHVHFLAATLSGANRGLSADHLGEN